MRKIAFAVAFGLALLVSLPSVSFAQRGGGRGGGGGGHGGYSGGHGGYGGYGGYGGHGGYYGGYGGYYPGIGFSIGFPGYYNYGSGYRGSSYYYDPGTTVYTDPSVVPSTSYYSPTVPSTPAGASLAPPPTAADHPDSINMEVRLPENADLWIEGQKMSQTGALRHFYSEPVNPNEKYHYEIRARWTDAEGKVVDLTKKVDVRAGVKIGVDFNSPQK